MPVRRSRLFLVASMSLAAFVVHELRYQLAFGARASDALSDQGHGYLQLVSGAIVLLLVCALAHLVHLVAQRGENAQPPRVSLRRGWLVASLALVAIFVAQELVEGAVAAGHPAGLDGVLGSGGWLALPLAALCGLVVVLAVREVHAAVVRARCWLAVAYAPSAPARHGHAVPAERVVLRIGVLARHLAGRAPPLIVG